MMLTAYTDGTTYRHNPGPMAWAVIYVRDDKIERQESGALYDGTNNKAELMAVIWAVEHETSEDMIVRTDSNLTLKIATGVWHARSNMALWDRFFLALSKRAFRGLETSFEYVKGHSSDRYNQRADRLARTAAVTAHECLREGKEP